MNDDEEEHDNQYLDGDEDEGIDALSTQALSQEVTFERPDLQNAVMLRTPASRKRFLEIVKSQPVSAELKQAQAEWIVAHMNEDVMLADFTPRKSGMFNSVIDDPMKYATLAADLDFDVKQLSACEADNRKPWFHSTSSDFMFAFRAQISRTSGPQRERLRNGVNSTETEVKSMTGKIETPQPQPKKRRRGLI